MFNKRKRAQGPAPGTLGTINFSGEGTPVFPYGPQQHSPGDPPNTSMGALQAGSQVQLLGSQGPFNGTMWNQIVVTNGQLQRSLTDNLVSHDSQGRVTGWIADAGVNWNTSPATVVASAPPVPASSTGCATSSLGVTSGSGVIVRSQPSNAGAVVGQIPNTGSPVYLGAQKQDSAGRTWIGVSTRDCTISGWTPLSNVSRVSTPTPAPAPTPVVASRPNGPSTNLVPTGTGQQLGYTVSGTPAHAYLTSTGKDLGLLVGPNQVVKPASGGKLWALYDLAPDGSVSLQGTYGTVPGAPPPPNASPVQIIHAAQYAPASPTVVVAPPPVVYAAPPPPTVFVPPVPTYAPPPPPQVAGVPGYDPAQAALIAGTAEGEAAAPPPTPSVDPLTASILLGGGLSDPSGMFSGMPGGFDPTTLAALSGANATLAYQMALQNGNYDPTGGMVGADGGDGPPLDGSDFGYGGYGY